jgi:hypothetical protein
MKSLKTETGTELRAQKRKKEEVSFGLKQFSWDYAVAA